MSRSGRPRRCSRITYSAIRSSLRVRDERNENAPRIESINPIDGASLVVLRRPLEIGVGDRVAMRVVCREAERAVDSRFELLRDHTPEPIGLVVNGIDVQPERLGEIELEEPVVANHLEGDPL